MTERSKRHQALIVCSVIPSPCSTPRSEASSTHHPLRSLASSLSALHSCYRGGFCDRLLASQHHPRESCMVESTAFVSLQIGKGFPPRPLVGARALTRPECVNLEPLLRWATGAHPIIKWPSIELPSTRSTAVSSHTARSLLGETARSSSSSVSSSAASVSTSRSTWSGSESGASYEHGLSSSSIGISLASSGRGHGHGQGQGTEGNTDGVVAVSFRSPYGQQDLLQLAQQARGLLQRRAFVHLWVQSPTFLPFSATSASSLLSRFGADSHYSEEDLWDAVNVAEYVIFR